ncbi:unnamed protein product [Zymoseptoria tritici ST99CH_3D1]|nr:unnamed protein product [Zymoseptoria tritici ST99CH_3D1]
MAENKLSQNTTTAHEYIRLWSEPLSLPANDFLAIYSDKVVWFDHFFGLHLIGPAAVQQLRERWLGAHDDYAVGTVSVEATISGAVVQLINKGVLTRDMKPKREASGKKFACHACYVLKIDEGGKVVQVDEYQPTYFDDQYYTERYVKRDGGPVRGA